MRLSHRNQQKQEFTKSICFGMELRKDTTTVGKDSARSTPSSSIEPCQSQEVLHFYGLRASTLLYHTAIQLDGDRQHTKQFAVHS